MLKVILNNVYTPISSINKAKYISISTILDNDDIFYLQLVDN